MNSKQLIISLVTLSLSFTAFSQEKPDLNFITKIIESEEPPQNISQFLREMPEQFLSQYTIQFSGFGLQKASETNPRVFLFDLKEGIVLTYNNDPQHLQYNEIEILSYNRAKEEFELSEITFKENENPKIVNNPPLCLACHQTGYGKTAYVRPIFNSFNSWTGFFGGVPLKGEELKKEINYIKKFNKKQKSSSDSDLNRYSLLNKPFPLVHTDEKNMENRPNHQLMNLLMFYNSRSIQKKISRNKLYKTVLPWFNLFYFDEKVNGSDQFGVINTNILDKKGCFKKNPENKDKLENLFSQIQDELRKNNAYFERSDSSTLKLLSLYQGMGYPLQSLNMSLGQDEKKYFLVDEKMNSPFVVIPGFLKFDFFKEFLEADPLFKLTDESARNILLAQGVLGNEEYVKILDEINPSNKIIFESGDENKCSSFYERMIPIFEKSLKSSN